MSPKAPVRSNPSALVVRDVKGTFSVKGQILTGLSRQDTLEARGEDFRHFRDAMV
jgi:hypothetical protein